MSDGFMIDDGWMTDSGIHDLANWYHEHCPDTTLLTFEAHLMIIRTYANLLPGSPLDTSAGQDRRARRLVDDAHRTAKRADRLA
jgi:hypothetical protein